MVTGPRVCSAARKKAATDVASRTSTGPAKTPCSAPSRLAARRTAASRTSPRATRAPASWKACAMPKPMPAPAPVMRTTSRPKSNISGTSCPLALIGKYRLWCANASWVPRGRQATLSVQTVRRRVRARAERESLFGLQHSRIAQRSQRHGIADTRGETHQGDIVVCQRRLACGF